MAVVIVGMNRIKTAQACVVCALTEVFKISEKLSNAVRAEDRTRVKGSRSSYAHNVYIATPVRTLSGGGGR